MARATPPGSTQSAFSTSFLDELSGFELLMSCLTGLGCAMPPAATGCAHRRPLSSSCLTCPARGIHLQRLRQRHRMDMTMSLAARRAARPGPRRRPGVIVPHSHLAAGGRHVHQGIDGRGEQGLRVGGIRRAFVPFAISECGTAACLAGICRAQGQSAGRDSASAQHRLALLGLVVAAIEFQFDLADVRFRPAAFTWPR